MPLYVRLDGDTLARLRRMAEQERRRPQDQAAVIIEQSLDAANGPDPNSPDHAGAERLAEELQP